MTDPRKPIFDAIRAAHPGKRLTTADVAAVDALLDSFKIARASLPPSPGLMTTSAKGIDLIHHFESLERVRNDGRVEAYRCPAGIWTIGWGNTGADPFHGGQIRQGTIWTRAQCDAAFARHLAGDERTVNRLVTAPTTQNQFDALVSFQYNTGALSGATLLKKHNAGDYAGAAAEFAKWNKARNPRTGKLEELAGLTRRRAAEARLYEGRA